VYQEHPDLSWFDSVYCPYHRWHIDNLLPREKTLGSLRAQWLVPEHRRPPRHEEFDVVNSFVAFNVVSRRNYREYHAACPDLWYLTNPVNMRRFPKATPKRDELIASWNGNAGHSNALHEDVKGFHSIVRPACARVGVPLVFAEYGLHRKTPAEMPEFYQQANVALSASLYEGASSAVMESMASGLAVVVTDCGNHREMQLAQLRRFGQTGIRIVERSIDAFEQELRVLKEDPTLIAEMGEINRESIRLDWSWDVWIEGFIEFLLTPLRGEA
jgi:glycosyltransferase involved in cell wall biosynthesis